MRVLCISRVVHGGELESLGLNNLLRIAELMLRERKLDRIITGFYGYTIHTFAR